MAALKRLWTVRLKKALCLLLAMQLLCTAFPVYALDAGEAGNSAAPTPQETETVSAAPEPAETAQPAPEPEHTDAPEATQAPPSAVPEPSAEPAPTPEPEPTEEPGPEETPSPTVPPEPTATPAPESTPAPSPAPTGRAPEEIPVDLAANSAPQYSQGRFSYGTQAKTALVDKVRYLRLARYDNRLGVELSPDINIMAYGTQNKSGAPVTVDGGSVYFYFLPDRSELGRVPDEEFAGWYLYSDYASSTPAFSDWSWNDSLTPFAAPIYNGELGDPAYDDKIGAEWTGLITEAFPELGPDAYELPLVGRWVPSTVAAAGAGGEEGLSLTAVRKVGENAYRLDGAPLSGLYADPIDGKVLDAAGPAPIPFDPERHEYYLRVDPEVEALDLSFLAYEPYYQYDSGKMAEPPVSISVTAAGGSEAQTVTAEYEWTPKSVVGSNGSPAPQNSQANPARSLWTVGDPAETERTSTAGSIPLAFSAGAGAYYNDISISVYAPADYNYVTDGAGKVQSAQLREGAVPTTYVFHVQRLTDPTLKQNPGNTPFGMIERDTSEAVWGTGTDAAAAKAEGKEYFRANRTFDFDSYRFPMDESNNNGKLYRGTYSEGAWVGGSSVDYDCDQTAVVAYQNMAFEDPGILLTDSQGDPVRFGASGQGAYQQSVRRSILLRWQSPLTSALIRDGQGTEKYYGNNGPAPQDGPDYEVLLEEDGSDLVDLRGLDILPGIYAIDYCYVDPLTGKSYSLGEQGSFSIEGKENAGQFRRTLVILPMPGDVNMDGVVNVSDAATLDDAMTLGADTAIKFGDAVIGSDRVATLVAARCMDVSADGKLNHEDVEALLQGYTPLVTDADISSYPYLPLPGGESGGGAGRSQIREGEGASAGKAPLSLVFMGKETGVYDDKTGLTSAVAGPRSNADPQEAIMLGDVFWVGVSLKGVSAGSAFDQKISDFRLSLTYDGRYLEPATLMTQADLNGMQGQGDTPQGRWEYMLAKYNLGGSNAVWARGGYRFASGTERAAEPVYLDTRAATPLEDTASGSCKELVFSLQLSGKESAAVSLAQGGTLLMVPFRMIKHPYGEIAPQLVELSLGTREFALNGERCPASFDARGGELFGSLTQNLRNQVYLPAGAGLSVTLGVDITPTTSLYNQANGLGMSSTTNGVYSTLFQNKSVPTGVALKGALPPGLEYGSHTGWQITGVPLQAGDYDFWIGDGHYRIVIEKAPLHIFAEYKERYYGESLLFDPYTKTNLDHNTYRYYTEDICTLDINRGTVNDGRSDSLWDLLGTGEKVDASHAARYLTEPVFHTYEDPGAALRKEVGPGSRVGSYRIEISTLPRSTNYNFILTDADDRNPDSYTYTPNTLAIYPRPVYVSGFQAGYNVGKIYDDSNTRLENCLVTTGSDGCTMGLPNPTETDGPGQYRLRALTGEALVVGADGRADVLTIRFAADFQLNADDRLHQSGATEKVFFLGDDQEQPRDVKITDITLVKDEVAANYNVNPSRDVLVTGTVARRAITEIVIHEMPRLNYTYGSYLGDVYGLVLEVISGSGSAASSTGKILYNKEAFLQRGLHANWVSKEEIAAGVYDNGKEFELNQRLSVTEHDGKYLCIWANSTDDAGNPVVVKTYSPLDKPFRIAPRELTLTAVPQNRYYGEANAPLTFTYDRYQLAPWDSEGKTLTGDGAELATVLKDYNYVAPQLKAVESLRSGAPELNAETPYSGAYQYITINGVPEEQKAGADNYKFVYSCQNSPTGAVTTSPDSGYTYFYIHQRPIVVQEITKEPLTTIYADTCNTSVKNLALQPDQFTLKLPVHDADSTRYYPRGGTPVYPLTIDMGYSVETPVVGDDEIGLTCSVTFVPDNSYWDEDLTFNYFNMEKAVDGAQVYDVQIEDLGLTGADKGNYVLVYDTNGMALFGFPEDAAYLRREYGDGGAPETYYVSGKGTVLLRPITALTLVNTPKMNYVYGDIFSPDMPESKNKPALRVELTYDTTYDNDPLHNTTSEVVEFQQTSYEVLPDGTRKYNTTFSERGLEICYVKDGVAFDPDHRQTLEYWQALQVREHDGIRLVVYGRRASFHAPKYSSPSVKLLTVDKAELPVRADRLDRYYGEPNTAYGFTFQLADLSEADQTLLIENGFTGPTLSGTVTATDGGTTAPGDCSCPSLQFLDSAFVGPVFTTDARRASPVKDQGRGSYPLELSGGSLSNYDLSYTDSAVYIYKRPVQVTGIKSDGNNPIYTIFSDTEARMFYTNVSSDRTVTERPGGYYANTYDPVYDAQVGGRDLLLTGSGLYGSDTLNLRLHVNYYNLPQDADMGEASKKPHDVKVDRVEMTPGYSGNSNYYLINEKETGTVFPAIGRVELRNITGIRISHVPDRFTYTYGEALDLAGLVVEITYNTIDGVETGKKADVAYYGPDYFESYGLYVNYYAQPTPPTGTAEREALIDGRRADSGDHLTIAPTHDAEAFSYDGQYIVVSARRHADQDFVEPEMLRLNPDATPNRGTPLKVEPLALTYTLEAGDKTYDGTRDTVGTLTLTNVFNQSGYVDAYHKNGVTDVVMVSVGADYETPNGDGGRFDQYGAFLEHVAEEGYTFTTGRYDPAPFENGLTYNPGYDRTSQLSFTFEDPNVNYLNAPDTHSWGEVTTIPVNAAHIVLKGPDARNYTISPAVTAETEADAEGYLGAARPEAVIHKADRPAPSPDILPTLQMDVHSNAVKLLYAQSLETVGDATDERDGALHFEYALQAVTQDAGGDYKLHHVAELTGTDDYQDRVFFGGEAVTPGWPAGYVPAEEDLSGEQKEGVVQGQLYPWADEDEAFTKAPDAYPGGGDYVYPGYELYETDRTPLERDTAYWAVVRVAETHNYKASAPLSSVEGMAAGTIQAALDTRDALDAAQRALNAAEPEDREELQAALDDARSAASQAAQALAGEAENAVADAVRASAERVETLKALAGEEKLPEEPMEEMPEPASAVKTYRQRLEFVSVKEREAAGEGEVKEKFDVPLLEAVWFTDLMRYDTKELLDAAARNYAPTRYFGYYWDAGRSAAIDLSEDGEPLDLSGPLEVECSIRDAEGHEEKRTITVNEDHTATLYVGNSSGGGGDIVVGAIEIMPRDLRVFLGADPVQLTVQFTPQAATIRWVGWSSSDPTVAKVDKNGLVTFVGVGEATITASASQGRQDSITVTVLPADVKETLFPGSVFDFNFLGSFMELDSQLRFYPDAVMTRGELAVLLAKVYCDNAGRKAAETPVRFRDLESGTACAEAAELLAGLGVVNGVEPEVFAAERTVTRAEMITMLARMLDILPCTDPDQPHAFADSGPADTWAWGYIDAMAREGILNGVGNGSFAPHRALTRAEAAAFVSRLLNADKGTAQEYRVIPSDVPESHWGYESILRSVNSIEPVPVKKSPPRAE